MPKTPHSPSPIDVLSHRFWEVNLHATRDTEHGPGDLDIQRETAPVDGQPNRGRVLLQISLDSEPGEKPPPYTGKIIAEGAYEVLPQYPNDPERLIRVTGASMLYGAVREMVSSITARGPHGMLTLPSVSFYEEAPKKKAAKKTAKKAAKKKTAKAKR